MPNFGLSDRHTLFINRQLLYLSCTKTASKIYLAEFKRLETIYLAL